MTPFDVLKELVNNQKTVSSGKLSPLVREIGQMIAKLHKKIYAQAKSINVLNVKYQAEKKVVDKHRVMAHDYENLKVKHSNLKREYGILIQKLAEAKGEKEC